LERQIRLQNDYILRPADGHNLGQQLRCIPVGTIKFPHPAQVPGRETGCIRVHSAQILRRGDSRAFFRPAADLLANLTVQFHLRQVCRHQCIQRYEHGAVIYGFSDVHPISSFPARARLFFYC